MKDIGEEIADRLQDFNGKLARGERIVASCTQKCGCHVSYDRPAGFQGDPECRICAGRGFTFDAVTIFGGDDDEH